jgi:hypothetical protein
VADGGNATDPVLDLMRLVTRPAESRQATITIRLKGQLPKKLPARERLRRESPLSSRLCPNDQINVTIEHLQERQYLIDGLAVVRLIEKAIELRRGGP